MVFAVEPLIWIEDVRGGGVQPEEQVLITESNPYVVSRAACYPRPMLLIEQSG